MPDGPLIAHASTTLSNPIALAVVGGLIGAAATGLVRANRQLDSAALDSANDAERSTRSKPRGLWGSSTFGLGIALVSIGLIAGYAAGVLLDNGTSTRSPEQLVADLCDAADTPDPGAVFLSLDDDLQHNLGDIEPEQRERATRAAAIVRSAANQPGPVDPELVQLLATELANAAELGGGAPCD